MILAEEILELLRVKMNSEFEYINPNFLLKITACIDDYYELDDSEIDAWIQDMVGG